ncbi:hypothetical protein [Bacillus sp. MUM 13]|uniref:hypothetical protein n=1 Tax=Bacillus sp. MUM 13 TaxID=1678001 RepID=UPI0008F5BBF4|nr:hypothetical protein [Bacillus sp. MUM 13]OIK14639.1 hypothetical protein BIV59_02480 [Bacillus sp. MUM 13]
MVLVANKLTKITLVVIKQCETAKKYIFNKDIQDKVSPLYFNAKSYKSSEVYKDLQEQRKEDEAYLKVKKKEAEERRRRELNADLARQVSNPREYLKAADKIGFTNLNPDRGPCT